MYAPASAGNHASSCSSRNSQAAPKRPRHEGVGGVEVAQEDDSEGVQVWGVLVSQNSPSRENGLLTYAQRCRCRRAAADAPGKGSARESMNSSSLRDWGEDWLWRRVPPAMRKFYFPACPDSENKYPCAPSSPEPSETSATAPLQHGGDKSHPLPRRLLLPLCGTRSNNGTVSLGRLASNDIGFVTNPCVSSVHCTITYHPGSDRGRGAATAEATAVAAEDKEEAQRATDEATIAVDRGGATARSAAAAEQQQQQPSVNAHVLLSDYSTNGCLVNGRVVGKGCSARLRDGDTVELINAGPRRTADYNLSFVFFSADAWVRWVKEQQRLPEVATTQGADEGTDMTARAARKEPQQHQALQMAARRRALLCRAQWNVEAQVRRMYNHSVDEYYSLDRAHPLGQGTFGAVYRATLRTGASASSQSASLLPTGGGIAAGGSPSWEYIFSSTSVSEWPANPADVARLRDAYIRGKEQQAPATVLRASASAALTTTWKAEATTTNTVSQAFAVKIIRKRRMLVEALQQLRQPQPQRTREGEGSASGAPVSCVQSTAIATTGSAGTVAGTISSAEATVIEQLLLLETQPDDLAAQRREEWTAGALASLQLADTMPVPLTPFSSLSAWRKSKHTSRDDDASDDRRDAQPSPQQHDREQRRRELIRCLPVALRRTYERELQHRRRQQCEINVLLAVRHVNVTALYEAFDQPDHLALVMEQATGGEVWDLLQAYKRRERGGQAGARMSDSATGGDYDYDDDLVSVGGPLPEFMVKTIITQVIEAVLYLHTMGIIHRDLKLENLMLHRPCDRYALNALQLQMLIHQLRAYAHQRHASDAPTSPTCASHTCKENGEAVEFTNPLSVLHTVHIPRHLWPVVKVMDFGLSRVLGHLQTPQDAEGRSSAVAVAATEAVPERVKLIYSRNDATTSCGTPLYAAPEVTNRALRLDKVGYSAAVDMYSVGVIAYALLTGRAPFPSKKHPRRPDGPPVVDYDAPLCFERRRRRPAVPQDDAGSPGGAAPLPLPRLSSSAARPPVAVACLPPLSLVESVRVVLQERAKTSAAPSAASAKAQQWHRHAEAVAAYLCCAEQTDAHAESSVGRSSAASADTFFDVTVEQLCASLTTYADMCASGGLEVDLDRLLYVSADAAATGVEAANASVGRVVSADGHITEVSLPPVSALGSSFLRGLLEKYPSRRLTAYEALQHPWLRECV